MFYENKMDRRVCALYPLHTMLSLFGFTAAQLNVCPGIYSFCRGNDSPDFEPLKLHTQIAGRQYLAIH